MALMPKRVKHRKSQRGRIRGKATRGNTVVFGDWALQSLDAGHITGQTIEACRIAATQYVRGEGRVFIRIFPQKSVTSRPLETRMGKGKGPLESWVAVIRPANVLFEVDGVPEVLARESMRLAATKLPIKTKFISRHKMG